MASILKAEKEQRIERVMHLLACLTPQAVADTIVEEMGVHRKTAQRYIATARDRINALIDVPRSEWIADTLHHLERIIRTGEAVHKLAALAQRTTLLGLQAPARVHVMVDALYSGPEQLVALEDAGLREKALSFEAAYAKVRSQQNGDSKSDGQGNSRGASDAAPQHPRLSSGPRLPVPGPPPDPPEGGADFTAL